MCTHGSIALAVVLRERFLQQMVRDGWVLLVLADTQAAMEVFGYISFALL